VSGSPFREPSTDTRNFATDPASFRMSAQLQSNFGLQKPDMAAMDAQIARPVPKARTAQESMADIQTALDAAGVGDAAKQYQAYLDKRRDDLGEQYKKDRRMALADAGFKMAMAASQPGQAGNNLTKFLSAAAVGGADAAQGIMALHKEQRANEQRLAEDQLKLQQSEELRKAGYVKDAVVLSKESERDATAAMHWHDQLVMDKNNREWDYAKAEAEMQNRIQVARLQAQSHPYGGVEMEHYNDLKNQGLTPQQAWESLQGPKHAAQLQANFEKFMATEEGQNALRIIRTSKDPNKVAAARNSIIQGMQYMTPQGLGLASLGVGGGQDLGNLFGPQ